MLIHYVHTRSVDSEKANMIQVLQMCKSFGELGHQVVLSVPAHQGANLGAEIVKERLGVRDLPFDVRNYARTTLGGRFQSTSCIAGCLSTVRAIPSDVLFIRDPVILPFVISHHSSVLYESHNNRVGPGWVLNSVFTRLLVRLSRKPQLKTFIAISDALRRWWFEQGAPSEKLMSAHDGVDIDHFSLPVNRADARKALALPVSEKMVVYTGSLYQDRGMDRVLRLAKDFPKVFFVIVGGPEEQKKKLERLAQNQGILNLCFTGHRPQKEIPLYLACADVLLMLWSKAVPTINYCSPLKLFEYLAAGRIIVGDGFPTIREVIEDGVHGYLVTPESYGELRDALLRALSTDASKNGMVERARERARHFSWGTRCRNILEFFQANQNQRIPVL